MVKFETLQAGFCYANEQHSIKGGQNRQVKFGATFGLIEHPTKGVVLFDTGYSRRFYESTSKYPEKIYSKLTKVYIKKEEEALEQLHKRNISPDEVNHVIISHFHADHIGGLKDFPNAKFHCTKKAFEQTRRGGKFNLIRKGILKDLIPEDFKSRVGFIEFENDVKTINYKHIRTYDLFDDNSIILVDLPGHAAGQIGAIIQSGIEKYFLVADAAWYIKQIEKNTPSGSMSRLIMDDWKEYKSTIHNLFQFRISYPDVKIIPCHCETSYQTYKREI